MIKKADLKVQRDFGMVDLPIQNTSSELIILSDFCLQVDQNLQNLETIFLHMNNGILKKPSLIVICGQFFKNCVIKNKSDNLRILDIVKNFTDLLKLYSQVLENINIFLIPGKEFYL